MVGRELGLEALSGENPRREHHPGVVHEHVHRYRVARDRGREGPHRVEVREVQHPEFDKGARALGSDPVDGGPPFASLRQVSVTRAPCTASWRAVSKPSPLFAPVTTKLRPDWLSIWAVVQRAMGAPCLPITQ